MSDPLPPNPRNVDENIQVYVSAVAKANGQLDAAILAALDKDTLAAYNAGKITVDQLKTKYTAESTTPNFIDALRKKAANVPGGIPDASQRMTQNEKFLMKLDGDPNPLNQYANYTYHVKLSMIDQNQAYSPIVGGSAPLSSLNQIVIAESGATANYNITKFSITNTVAPGFKHRNQMMMEWKMTITEPFGLTLFDYMIGGAKQLNISNSSRFPLFIEVYFNGYDEAGNIVKEKMFYKKWRVIVTDMNLTVGHIGTSYDFTGVADNNMASSNQMALTPATLKMDGVRTMKDAVTKLETALNKAAKDAENKQNGLVNYKIEIPKEIESWEIVSKDSDKNSNKQGSMFGLNSAQGGNEIMINRGQDIGNFVVYMMSKCGDKATDYLKGTAGNGSTPSAEKNGLGTIVQLFSSVKLGDYDPMLNDYAKTVSYKIVPYSTTRIVADPQQAKLMEQLSIQQAKANYLVGQKLLAKRYDYIYTGKNTEVLKFDIHVDSFWSIALSTYLGGKSYAQYTQGPVVDPKSQGFRENVGYGQSYKLAEEVQARVKDIDKLLKSVKNVSGSAGQILSDVTKLTSNLSNLTQNVANLSPGDISKMVAQLNNASTQFSKLATLTADPIVKFDSTENRSTLAKLATTAANISSALQGSLLAANPANVYRNGQYLEDIKTQIQSDDELKVAFMIDNEPRGQEGTQNGSEAKNQPSANAGGYAMPNGASLFGTVMSNIYDKNMMVEIDLEVRGDPWWIGLTNLEEEEYAASLNTAEKNPTFETANWMKGENLFLLNFKTGNNYDEETGFMRFNPASDYFNGLYAVREVENRFENGSFTQNLKAFKELFAQKVSKEATSKVTTSAASSKNSGLAVDSAGPVAIGENGPLFAG